MVSALRYSTFPFPNSDEQSEHFRLQNFLDSTKLWKGPEAPSTRKAVKETMGFFLSGTLVAWSALSVSPGWWGVGLIA
jgi:hypothetical protein